MISQAKVNQLCEDNELAFFRADVCLGSPESFSLEEKATICEDMDVTNEAIEDAIRKDFDEHARADVGVVPARDDNLRLHGPRRLAHGRWIEDLERSGRRVHGLERLGAANARGLVRPCK